MDKAEALVSVLKSRGVDVPRVGNVLCVLHSESTPSMSIDRERGLYKCHSCGKGGDVFTLLNELEGLTYEEAVSQLGMGEQMTVVAQHQPLYVHERVQPVQVGRMEHLETLLEHAESRLRESDEGKAYLKSRGISGEMAARFRLGIGTPEFGSGNGSLVIPYLGIRNRPVSLRTRCIEDHDHIGHGKYMGGTGESVRMFNTRAITDDASTLEVHISEGEMDAISLTQCGLMAVGFPGVNSVKPHHVQILRSFETVYIWGDNDKAGHEFTERLMQAIPQARTVHLPDGDVNATLVARGESGVLERIGR